MWNLIRIQIGITQTNALIKVYYLRVTRITLKKRIGKHGLHCHMQYYILQAP